MLKSEFVLSLCEQLVGSGKLTAKEKSLIDRCTALVYRPYIAAGCKERLRRSGDFHREMLLQPEPERRMLLLQSSCLLTAHLIRLRSRQTSIPRVLSYLLRHKGSRQGAKNSWYARCHGFNIQPDRIQQKERQADIRLYR